MQTKYSHKHEHYIDGRLPHHPGVEGYLGRHYLPGKTVLELGAGTGMGTAMLSSYFDRVVAVEPVLEMVEYGKRTAEQTNVTFINSTVERLEVNELEYDYLICFQATHWFYETSTYQTLYAKASQPIIDVCSFITFPEDQGFFDELAKEHTITNSHRGTTYPFDVAEEYSYQRPIDVVHAAHQLCSRSWADHTKFGGIRRRIAERYKHNDVVVKISTRIHTVHTN